MGVLWVGANPGLRLFVDGQITAWSGFCHVEWSMHGSGQVLSLWRDGRARVLSPNRELAVWMIETFVGPMSRSPSQVAEGVPWADVQYEVADVEMTINLDTGLRGRAGDIAIEMARPLDRQLIYRDDYDIEGQVYRVSFVNVPCAEGAISVGDIALPGQPQLWSDESGRLRSTAQIAVAEVWATQK